MPGTVDGAIWTSRKTLATALSPSIAGRLDSSGGPLNKPIGVSRYELPPTLPEELKARLPTLEEVEQGLSDEKQQESD
jgi:hypothetical protein